ncbi:MULTISPECIES: monovalent cation/H(+) antiporter subunit G [unclassified Carboxylicivirga]|uniref:monovalent cation/H(+) antiporter subunit G n=1 Tax=Carboxylicivirga TaxID=1628153 RepID=UPI003D33C975
METLIAIFTLLGAAFILIAAIGLLRFKNFYSRMHATTKATSFGMLWLILGVALFFSTSLVWLKALLVMLFIYLTAPLAAHATAKSDREEE